jgi:hypothetical protein
MSKGPVIEVWFGFIVWLCTDEEQNMLNQAYVIDAHLCKMHTNGKCLRDRAQRFGLACECGCVHMKNKGG